MLTRHPRCFSQRVGATFAEGLGSQTPQILFATQDLEVNFTSMLGGVNVKVGKGAMNWTKYRDPSDEFNIYILKVKESNLGPVVRWSHGYGTCHDC